MEGPVCDFRDHVMVPTAMFNAMAEVYYAAKRGDLVPRRDRVTVQQETEVAERVGEAVDWTQMELDPRFGVPPGLKPRGVAARELNDGDGSLQPDDGSDGPVPDHRSAH